MHQKNLQQSLMSSPSLNRLHKNNPLFGEVLSGVSMIVHEPIQNQARERIDSMRPLIAKRGLIKRRD